MSRLYYYLTDTKQKVKNKRKKSLNLIGEIDIMYVTVLSGVCNCRRSNESLSSVQCKIDTDRNSILAFVIINRQTRIMLHR
jgi:hypothetical protein